MLFLLILLSAILTLGSGERAWAINPENVLVLYNDDQGASGPGSQIANYYQQARPGVHLAPLSGIDAILTGAFGEDVSGQDYLDVIKPQVDSAIAAIPDVIDVIVTTKGLPLRIDTGPQPVGDPTDPTNWKRFSSLESELTRVDSIDTIGKMGNQFLGGFPQIDGSFAHNPYYALNNINTPFAHVGSGGFFNSDFRLSSRLDGYSVESVMASIDRAQNAYIVPTGHFIILDDTGFTSVDQMTNGTGPGIGAFETITSLYPDDGVTNPVPVILDHTNTAMTTSYRDVLGYVSHGTNDGVNHGLSDNYLGQFVDGVFVPGELDFNFAAGAVFHTHESFNAQSFHPDNPQVDGLVADWIEQGGTAGLGHVAEPQNGHVNVTNEDLFYRMLLPAGGAAAAPGTEGMTFVESAWYATRQLSFVNTVVGDPLMTLKAWLPGDANLDGRVEFNDFYTLQGNWMQYGNFADGDFNGDKFVDVEDLTILSDNWLSSIGPAAFSVVDIGTAPDQDPNTGFPEISAWLVDVANLNQDLHVDSGDLAVIEDAYAQDASGDIDGDGRTTGLDFLLWQQGRFSYEATADFDFDAHVTASDRVIWENSYAKNLGGDTNGDGRTDGLDFLTWQQELRIAPASQSAAVTTTPEPSGIFLALIGTAGMTLGRWRN